MTNGEITITDLRNAPQFAPDIADRIWRAWWRPNGFPLEHITALIGENLGNGPLPFAIVAHQGSTFVGTASVIASDMEERPDYTPWVAGSGSIHPSGSVASAALSSTMPYVRHSRRAPIPSISARCPPKGASIRAWDGHCMNRTSANTGSTFSRVSARFGIPRPFLRIEDQAAAPSAGRPTGSQATSAALSSRQAMTPSSRA